MKKIWSKIQIGYLALLPDIWTVAKKPEDFGLEEVKVLILAATTWLVAIAGGLALIYLLVGGYQYMISLGNEEMATKAKSTLTWAIIGFIVVIGAYLIIRIVAQLLLDQTHYDLLF